MSKAIDAVRAALPGTMEDLVKKTGLPVSSIRHAIDSLDLVRTKIVTKKTRGRYHVLYSENRPEIKKNTVPPSRPIFSPPDCEKTFPGKREEWLKVARRLQELEKEISDIAMTILVLIKQ